MPKHKKCKTINLFSLRLVLQYETHAFYFSLKKLALLTGYGPRFFLVKKNNFKVSRSYLLCAKIKFSCVPDLFVFLKFFLLRAEEKKLCSLQQQQRA